MKFLPPLILAVGFATCSQNVELTEPGTRVELVSHTFLGTKSERCTELERFEVLALASEKTNDSRYDILDIKALNEGARRGATHVLRWPDEEFACGLSGEPNPASKQTCRRGDVTAYECIMGNPP